MHFSIKTLMAAVAVSACAAAFAADMPKSISITYVKAPFNLQNIVMKERGMLEKAFEKDGVKIKWRVINSGALQGQAMASGDLDFSAVMNTASLLMAAGAGNPIAVATGVAHPKEIFAMVGRPGTNFAVKDLKGKKVAGPKGTVLHQLLVAALLKEGMTINDVQFINIKANEAGAKTITTCEGLVEPNLVMTVRRAFAVDYPEAYEKVVAVNRAALKWIQEHQDEALQIGAKEQGVTVADAKKLYAWSNFYDTLTDADIQSLAKDQEFLVENGMMDKKVDVKSLILPSALK